MKLCIVVILIAVNCRLAWSLQNCLSDDRPICVIHEDCSYTLYNKCILEFHKQITINEKKPPIKNVLTGSCPKGTKLCPYNRFLPGITFE
ncbi:uncharacterized protein LOC119547908 [Drosophila subpulchrella]|uniref:uncharacterized protein LOC119547908 n=1 Tax=Drosophila subpulchrella TaxID=1486046 RepID=UPI0018A1885B|nr:uncharacterized protein LOC119547908 [Drosophila subpulchrella]